jgi:hypothetical protein
VIAPPSVHNNNRSQSSTINNGLVSRTHLQKKSIFVIRKEFEGMANQEIEKSEK